MHDREKKFRVIGPRIKYLQDDVSPALQKVAKQAICLQDLSQRANAADFDNPAYSVTVEHPQHIKVQPGSYTVKMTLRERSTNKPIFKKSVPRRYR